MRIAVTYENGEIFQHFGHTESFKIYEIKDNKVISEGEHNLHWKLRESNCVRAHPEMLMKRWKHISEEN